VALLAYTFRKRTDESALNAEYIPIESAKERETCEALIQRGLLGPSLALQFQPSWKRYLNAIVEKTGVRLIWWRLFNLARGFWISS
jgi:hypothetical protein